MPRRRIAPERVMVGLMAAAAAYWLWLGLVGRSITGDDGISILAARSILEHGMPQLPSGFIYHRAYAANYLLAGSMAIFGVNDFGILLPSLLMALGGLWLVFCFASDFLRKPWAGLAAAVLLVTLQCQSFYATSARMYMALQFFTVLAWYSAWRGYAAGERRFQWLAIAASAAAVLSHQQGGAMLAAVPLSIAAARLLGRGRQAAFSPALAMAGVLAVGACVWWSILYKPSWRVPLIAGDGGINPEHTAFSLDLSRWLAHLLELESTVPLGLVLLPAVAGMVLTALRRRGREDQAVVYTASLLLLLAASAVVVVRRPHWRFWAPMLPLYVLLLAAAVPEILHWARKQQAAASAVMAGWVLAVGLAASAAFGPAIYLTHARKAYGIPCRRPQETCSPVIEAAYDALRPLVDKDDRIVSSNPPVTHYYLGRMDGFLRQKGPGGSLGAFSAAADELFGAPLIDTAEELKTLADSPRRVWVIADYKTEDHVSPAMLAQLRRLFRLKQQTEQMAVYANR